MPPVTPAIAGCARRRPPGHQCPALRLRFARMEPNDILKKAWDAVQASGVPESMHETAFREAVAILRDEADGSTQGTRSVRPTTRVPHRGDRKAGTRAATPERPSTASSSTQVPDAATFFSALAHESGVDEAQLRDVLTVGSDGTVNITPPTRTLGGSKAEQARTVVALLAPARLIGLQESPVSGDALRKECRRKNCFDTNNFASTVIGALAALTTAGAGPRLS